jgi:hypothetical protein
MGRDATRRYVNEVLELSGVRSDGTDRVDKISELSDQGLIHLAEDISKRALDHYKKNLPSILHDLQKMKKPKAYYLPAVGALAPRTEASDWFVRKCALYYNRIVVWDFLEESLFVRTATRMTTTALKWYLRDTLTSLSTLWPWFAEGFLEMVPRPSRLQPIADRIVSYADEDSQDSGWQQQALRYEDLQLEGEAYLRHMERAAEIWPPDLVQEVGGLRPFALRVASHGSSVSMGSGFFGSYLTGSSPTTDSRQSWRLFGCWISRRAERLLTKEFPVDRLASFVRELKAGRAWFALDAKELGVLTGLPAAKISEIRNSTEYSFRHFREDLGDAVDEIEAMELDDEKAYREAANQAWNKVRDSAESVKRDLPGIEKKLKVDGVATTGLASFTLGLYLGLAPAVPPAALGLGSSAAVAARDLAKAVIDYQELKKSSGYFLAELEKAEQSAQTVQ